MKYISVRAFAGLNKISVRWVQELCRTGRIAGATKFGENGAWMIPENTSISNNIRTLHGNLPEEKEVIKMVDAEKQMKTGQMMLNRFDLDMAAVYFEFAGEEFIRRGEYQNAFTAYNKTLYCLETDGKHMRVKEIKAIIADIRKKLEDK